MAVSRTVALKLELADNLKHVEIDVSQIQQVFVNLVINASEAISESEQGGEVCISTAQVWLDSAYLQQTVNRDTLEEGCYVMIRVSDTGVGIGADALAQIFDPFYTSKFTGRGLGLAAVLGIIRGHRGSIKVFSDTGQGTTFEVAFPCIEQRGSKLPKASVPSVWEGQGTVLVVDDEPAVLRAGKRLLRRMGFSVVEAADGRQALTMVGELIDRIDCVLLDITMPGMGGVAVMVEIRRLYPELPVILTSGYSEKMAVDVKSGIRPHAFLQKPYNFDSLSKVLSQVLSKARIPGSPTHSLL